LDLQGHFEEMQGEPIQFRAESPCALRGSNNSSLSKEQGGVIGIAGKGSDANGPDAGIHEHAGADPNLCDQRREGEHTASGSAMPVSDRSGTYFVLGL
jgi:hypothetical protein